MISSAALNTVQEFIVASLPVAAVFEFGVHRQQRWPVVSLLSLGYLVALCGTVRTYFVWLAMTSSDPSWVSTPHWICSQAELGVALVSCPVRSTSTQATGMYE